MGDIRSGSVKRVASAVGEGSVAIALVHRVLAEWSNLRLHSTRVIERSLAFSLTESRGRVNDDTDGYGD